MVRRVQRVPIAAKLREDNWRGFGDEDPDYLAKEPRKALAAPVPQDEQLKAPRNMGMSNSNNEADDEFSSLISVGADGPLQKRQISDIQRYFAAIYDSDPQTLVNLAEKEESAGIAAAALAAMAAGNAIDKPHSYHPRVPETDDRTLRVSNLPEYTSEQELQTLFGRCGVVSRCHVARNK